MKRKKATLADWWELIKSAFTVLGLFCISVWGYHHFYGQFITVSPSHEQVYLVETSWWGISETWNKLEWRYSPGYEFSGWMTKDDSGNWIMRIREPDHYPIDMLD